MEDNNKCNTHNYISKIFWLFLFEIFLKFYCSGVEQLFVENEHLFYVYVSFILDE